MIVLKLIRYLRGYVWFEARGVFVERFLNLIARSHIPVWEGRKRGEVYTGCVVAKDYRQLRAHAKKTNIRLRVINKKGVPFTRHKYRGRRGILVGLGIFVAFLFVMSQFVWRIEVSGNEAIPDTEILHALDNLGIAPGTLRATIDVRDVERRMLLEIPELSWFALNLDGSAATAEVSESTAPPVMVDPNDPCNIIATEAGQILAMNVYEGQAIVQIGDTVLPGDIIVSGITQDGRGQSLFRHARAEVYAQTQVVVDLEVPLNQTAYRETGKITKRGYLGVFKWEVPVFLPFLRIPAPYHVERTTTQLEVFSAQLPFHWLQEEYYLMEEVPVTYTEEEAKLLATKELALIQQARLGDAEVLDKSVTGKLTDDSFAMQAIFICKMDIAAESEIAIRE